MTKTMPDSGFPSPASHLPIKEPVFSLAMAIIGMSIGAFALGISEFSAMSMLDSIVREFHLNPAQGQSAISFYALGVVIGAPLVTTVTAKIDRKKLLIYLLFFYCIANVLTALAFSYNFLISARFFAGLEHGTYFGVASMVAVYISPPQSRAKAVSRVVVGLSVATMVGVPLAQWFGDHFTWRMTYVCVAICALLAANLIYFAVPSTRNMQLHNPLTELNAVKNMNVWLTLLIGVTGFGTMFAIYTYIDFSYANIAHLTTSETTFGLVLFGLGMIIGSLLGGKLADWNRDGALVFGLVFQIINVCLYLFLSHQGKWIFLSTLLVGVTGGFPFPALQTRLIDVAGKAGALAAALNQSALNLANAIGAFLAGHFLGLTGNYDAPAYVGLGLSCLGLVMIFIAIAYIKIHPPQQISDV